MDQDSESEVVAGLTAPATLRVGDLFDVEVGAIAHGGHCVAHAVGRTLLVRHALPGERVRVRITAVASKVSRADAVEILRGSPRRVPAPCPLARPAGCGGCDFQHADLAYQRQLKAQVVADAFRRHARVDGLSIEVEPLPGDDLTSGQHWRTRMRWQVGPGGILGLRAHRSTDVIPVAHCLIAAPAIAAPPQIPTLDKSSVVRTAVGSDGKVAVLLDGGSGERRSGDGDAGGASRRCVQQVKDRRWRVDAGTFWQAHPAAAQALVEAVLQFARPHTGQRWWDLFAGAGLFSAFLGQVVGPEGVVAAVEGNAQAVRDARRSLHDLPQVRLHHQDVLQWLGSATESVDGVVLDPPRTGMGAQGMALLTTARPPVIVYVACDPVALARDVALAAEGGYRLKELRAFDAFPMTHHVEVVATLIPG